MTATVELRSPERVRRRFVVRGVVQGVGFRPFVYCLATELGLSGSVANDSSGVLIEVQGHRRQIEVFGRRLSQDAPPLAILESVESIELDACELTGFSIGQSQRTGTGHTLTSPDIATCADCLRELADPADRRYRHPFISCTNCGPRFTIITGLPYDRPTTTMARFAMCPPCAVEYADPADRRFHAQTIACPDCGPRLELIVPGQTAMAENSALASARELLAAGAILAVKGLGGYHLACDGTNELAVATLRARKARGDKPFAVMVPDLATARALTLAGSSELGLLTSARRPIVLLARRRPDGLAAAVAPGNPDLGVLLPYTPLHTLLFSDSDGAGSPAAPTVLVMTSANLSGEPIVFDDDDALIRLAPLADGWLRHDRPIEIPVDDSVARVVDGAELPIRRSRGYAPLPIPLPSGLDFGIPPMLAVGADLKNACCLAENGSAWLSQHVGDMADLRTLQAFAATADQLRKVTGVEALQLAADAHPGYRSTNWAHRNADGRPVHPVQHHHAHLASLMAEHGLDGRTPVIGFAFDGTGYGTDGAIWGGELLIANYHGFRRFAHLDYVPLPGGDAAVARPYRMALAHLHAAGLAWDSELAPVRACPPDERRVLQHQLRTGLGCVPTSSMGRLFDAVSSLAGVRQVADYEAQAAIELEGLSRGVNADAPYRYQLRADGGVGVASVIGSVVHDVTSGLSAALIGARFSAGTIALVHDLAVRARHELNLHTVALSGGVFQNAALLAGACAALRSSGFTVLRHQIVPPNDGGLALGQLVVAAAKSATQGGQPCA